MQIIPGKFYFCVVDGKADVVDVMEVSCGHFEGFIPGGKYYAHTKWIQREATEAEIDAYYQKQEYIASMKFEEQVDYLGYDDEDPDWSRVYKYPAPDEKAMDEWEVWNEEKRRLAAEY